jgi:hypothetical protein
MTLNASKVDYTENLQSFLSLPRVKFRDMNPNFRFLFWFAERTSIFMYGF